MERSGAVDDAAGAAGELERTRLAWEAVELADTGERRWVDAPELGSCHTVWIQFLEDLLATLAIPRGSDA